MLVVRLRYIKKLILLSNCNNYSDYIYTHAEIVFITFGFAFNQDY